jgi:hypothetical protein
MTDGVAELVHRLAWLLSLSREALDSGVVKSDSEIGNVGRQVARLVPGESRPDSRDGKLAAAVRGLLARPELVKAVYATLIGDSGPTPDDVAAWLVGYHAREPTQSGGGSM